MVISICSKCKSYFALAATLAANAVAVAWLRQREQYYIVYECIRIYMFVVREYCIVV